MIFRHKGTKQSAQHHRSVHVKLENASDFFNICTYDFSINKHAGIIHKNFYLQIIFLAKVEDALCSTGFRKVTIKSLNAALKASF